MEINIKRSLRLIFCFLLLICICTYVNFNSIKALTYDERINIRLEDSIQNNDELDEELYDSMQSNDDSSEEFEDYVENNTETDEELGSLIQNDDLNEVKYDNSESSNTVTISTDKKKSVRKYTDITGTLPHNITRLDQLYYGSVENDDTAPFHNASELQEILENGNEEYAKNVWKKYQYDLWDPNFESRGGSGALWTPSGNKKPDNEGIDRPDYADEILQKNDKKHTYPKDDGSPFHVNPESQIESVADATLVDGVLIENDDNVFTDMKKTASPDNGDANINREYTVDLKAKANLKQTKPIVLLFQIQTSWQMFDLFHANDNASLVNNQAVTKELLSLYEMKQAFIDFMDWIEDYTNGSLMIGITNFYHGGSESMFGTPYFTNNADAIMEGLYGWDTFGDCEHIHYSDKALDNAIKELSNESNFINWVDKNNTSIYENAELVSVIVGGACEADDLKFNNHLPDLSKKDNAKLTKQYGIRTNSGTGVIANDMISWMDYEAQGNKNTAGKFDTGKYYTDVVTREDFFNTLLDIYQNVQDAQEVPNVTIEDTVSAEFEVKESEIKAFVNGVDVTNSANITVEKQPDGTTKVICKYAKVNNHEEVHLQIPVQAKNDFIGSNNVKTNTGIPTISYKGRIDTENIFTQNFTDKPAVNVPIRFEVNNGRTVSIAPGQSIDLADLSKDVNGDNLITKVIEDALDKYGQTEGTITYQWVDSNGNKVGTATTATIDGTNRTPPDIPSYTFTGKEEDIDKEFTYALQVTFTPADIKTETTSKIPVGELTKDGDAIIDITQKQPGKIRIKKIIDNYGDYDSSLKNDEFMIQINSTSGTSVSSEVVLNHEETSGYIEITEATVLNIEEILPMEYVFAGITVKGSGYESSDITGSSVYVERGDDITITVHNRYEWKPFFHAFDSIMNLFKRK